MIKLSERNIIMFSIIKSFLEKLLSKLASLFGFVSKEVKDHCAAQDLKPSTAIADIFEPYDVMAFLALRYLKEFCADLSGFNTGGDELNAMMKETLGIPIHEVFIEINNIPDVEFGSTNYFTEVFGDDFTEMPVLDLASKLLLILAVLTKRSSNLKHIDDHNYFVGLIIEMNPKLPVPEFTGDDLPLDNVEFFSSIQAAAGPFLHLTKMDVVVTKENIDKFRNLSARNILLVTELCDRTEEGHSDLRRKTASIISGIPFDDFNPNDRGFIVTGKQQVEVDDLLVAEKNLWSTLKIFETLLNFGGNG